MSIAESPYLTRPESAQYLRVSLRNIDKAASAGLLKKIKLSRRRTVFHVDDLKAFADSCRSK